MRSAILKNLIRSKRRTLALGFTPDGALLIRAPLKMPLALIENFLAQKQPWIQKHQAILQQRHQETTKAFEETDLFFYLGQTYQLIFSSADKTMRLEKNQFLIQPQTPEQVKKNLRKWYRQMASEILQDRLDIWAQKTQLLPKQLKITSATQRWGSCSAKGTICLTWRLIMAPIEIIDYVVVHELAHLVVKNHSAKFWQQVASILPNFRRQKKWLSEHGHLLKW